MQHPHPAYQTVQPVQQEQQVQQVQHEQKVQYGLQVQTVQPVQLQYPVQQPLTIVTQPTPQPSGNYFLSSALKQMRVLSSIQISMGILCIVFGLVTAALAGFKYRDVSFPESIGYGIWIGLFFVAVGVIGMGAVKHNTNCWITATMVLNIFCASLWCEMLVGFNTMGLGITAMRRCYDSRFYSDDNFSTMYGCLPSKRNTIYALDSLMLIMGIIQFAITIWCAVLCCGAICRCCKGATGGNMQVQQVQHGHYGQPVQQVQQLQQVQHVQPVQQVQQPTPQLSGNYFRISALKQMTVLSSIQLSMGIFCVIFGIVITALARYKYHVYDIRGPESIGYGIWIGLLFVAVGGIGMEAVKRNTNCWITATMVLNILYASLWWVLLVFFSTVGMVINSTKDCNNSRDDTTQYNYYLCLRSTQNTFNALDSMMLIMSVIQFPITIWCACLCCGAICRCCKGTTGGNMYHNRSVPPYPYQVTQPTVAGQGYAIDRQKVQVGGLVTSPPSYTSVAPPMQGGINPNYTSQSSAIPSQSSAGTETHDFIPQTQSAKPQPKA